MRAKHKVDPPPPKKKPEKSPIMCFASIQKIFELERCIDVLVSPFNSLLVIFIQSFYLLEIRSCGVAQVWGMLNC
jgi:hypothetical protein